MLGFATNKENAQLWAFEKNMSICTALMAFSLLVGILICVAQLCLAGRTSQDRCSNLQPTVCAMSHCFRFHYQQCNNYIIIDTHCQHHDNQVWPLQYLFHSTLGSSLLRSTLRSLSFARTSVLL